MDTLGTFRGHAIAEARVAEDKRRWLKVTNPGSSCRPPSSRMLLKFPCGHILTGAWNPQIIQRATICSRSGLDKTSGFPRVIQDSPFQICPVNRRLTVSPVVAASGADGWSPGQPSLDKCAATSLWSHCLATSCLDIWLSSLCPLTHAQNS